MENITNIRVSKPCDSSIKPFRFFYVQDGVEKSKDILKVKDNVSIILYNTTRNVLLFVRKFRPAIYFSLASINDYNETIDLEKCPPRLGITLELCERYIDNESSSVDEAREAINRIGYSVSTERLEEVIRYRGEYGRTGPLQTMFFCELSDNDKVKNMEVMDVEADGSNAVVEYTVDDARNLIDMDNSTSSPRFLFGILWFMTNKVDKFIST